MIRQLLLAGAIGLASLAVAQFAQLSSSPADLEGSEAPALTGPTSTAAQTSKPVQPPQEGPRAMPAPDRCDAAASADGASGIVDRCLLQAALSDDEAVVRDSLRRAAQAMRTLNEHESSDSTLLLAAGLGERGALLDYGAVAAADASEALVRREALLAAESLGQAGAIQALRAYRSHFDGQALMRPQVLVALIEGRGDQVGATVENDRYLVGLAESLVQSCPWQSPLWDGVGFRKSLEMFAAPLRSSAHARLVNNVGSSMASTVSAGGRLLARMWDGETYPEAGADFLRDVRSAHRQLSVAASRGSETGARDGVRLSELQGCASADGLRLVRGLRAVFEARVTAQMKTTNRKG